MVRAGWPIVALLASTLSVRSVEPELPGLIQLHRPAPEFPPPGLETSGTDWLNSPPLRLAQLRGHVVLVDFWEYTCINCIRTFPANLEWYRRYHSYGFEIVGVHAPEFEAARNIEHVRTAVRHFGLPYPIVVDNHYLIWKAYGAQGWPARYLIDATGTIRYARTGEGADASFEQAIRELLREAHPGRGLPPPWLKQAEPDSFAPSCGITTPEMYVGPWFGRGVLDNPEGYRPGRIVNYLSAGAPEDGRVRLEGRWETNLNGMIYRGSNARDRLSERLVIRYHAREVYAVLNVDHGRPGRVYVQQDGHWLRPDERGADIQVDAQSRSFIRVAEARMYYVVSNPRFAAHTLTLLPAIKGVMVSSFTFGNDCQLNFPHR